MERNDEVTGMEPGTSEVHSEMRSEPSKGIGNSGSYDAGAAGTLERARDEITERADGLRDRARDEISDRMDDLRDRAGEKIDNVRDEASRLKGELGDRANRALEESGARARVQEYPLFALGAAFGLGYLLAGSGGEKRGVRGKVRNQARAIIVGGITAAVAQQARSMLGMESGQSGGLGNLFGSALETDESYGTSAAGRTGRGPSAYGA